MTEITDNEKDFLPVIDWGKQIKEKNTHYQDYPMRSYWTNTPLKKWFSGYYKSWAEYQTMCNANSILPHP